MRASSILFVLFALIAVAFALTEQETIDAHGQASMNFFNERVAAAKAENEKLSALTGLGISGVYGIDFSTALSTSTLQCLKGKLSSTAFTIPRGYRSSGSLDPNVVSNIANSRSAGFQYVDAYLFPCPKCGTSGASQVQALASKLKSSGSKFGMIWLDIEGSQYWSSSTSTNVNFMSSMLSGCSSAGVSCGVYASASQWGPIMGTSSVAKSYPLWYPRYNNVANFNDFSSFGGWSKPNIKQYTGDATMCGAGVDLNVY